MEYEALPTVCFSCGKYGHVKELCPTAIVRPNKGDQADGADAGTDAIAGGDGQERRSDYEPWMLVERRSRRVNRPPQATVTAKSRKEPLGSQFSALIEEGELQDGNVDDL